MDKKEVKEKLIKKLEYCKQKELLAVIFFDGENRSIINYWKNKRKEVEKMISEIEG